MRCASVLLVVVFSLVVVEVAASATQGRVTVIGDSVADAMEHSPQALDSLSNGFQVDLETRGCRRLRAPSCTIAGVDNGPPPTAVQLVNRLGGSIGKTVVVNVGYNDTQYRYARDLDAVMGALQRVGVRTVIWLTLRDPDGDYLVSNRAIKVAPKKWPQLVVSDWDGYSEDHPAWFQPDGIHLTLLGAARLGSFIRQSFVPYVRP